MLILILREKDGGLKKLNNVFSDPKNLYGCNR